ncbi:MAG: hypothetical protein CMB58_002935 [Methanobacteriota archaeon]|nr:MAG: hypothetical protein CMB58_002935 [Euryarchaeota archaeon]
MSPGGGKGGGVNGDGIVTSSSWIGSSFSGIYKGDLTIKTLSSSILTYEIPNGIPLSGFSGSSNRVKPWPSSLRSLARSSPSSTSDHIMALAALRSASLIRRSLSIPESISALLSLSLATCCSISLSCSDSASPDATYLCATAVPSGRGSTA